MSAPLTLSYLSAKLQQQNQPHLQTVGCFFLIWQHIIVLNILDLAFDKHPRESNRWGDRSLLLSIIKHDRLVHNRTFWYSDWFKIQFNLLINTVVNSIVTKRHDFLKISANKMWIKYYNYSFIFILSQQRVYLMVCLLSRTYKVYSHIKLSSSSRIAYLYYVNFPRRDVVDLQRSVLARNWVM